MQHGNHRAARLSASGAPAPANHAVVRVDGGEWLVQQNQRRVLHHDAGEQYPLKLPGRQGADRALGKLAKPTRRQASCAACQSCARAAPNAPICRQAPVSTVSSTLTGKLRSICAACGR